ncbi:MULTISPECIES: hypothetical protein [unclassified Streptomyces]|uniref:hypothetical protein n=1 Tax=unclassified Streptomyces TaxID=2593676 RepID=UPI0033C05FC0
MDDLVFSVQVSDRARCVAELERLCAAFGLVPVLSPTRSTGTGRWMARCAPPRPQPEPSWAPEA